MPEERRLYQREGREGDGGERGKRGRGRREREEREGEGEGEGCGKCDISQSQRQRKEGRKGSRMCDYWGSGLGTQGADMEEGLAEKKRET